MTDIDQTIYKMLTTNTGIHMLDSGGDDGRAWQRNQKKTIEDFLAEPEVSVDDQTYNSKTKEYERVTTSEELDYTISLFHFLRNQLEFDTLCNEYNALPCDDWESDIYGVSKDQAQWLEDHDLIVGESWNSYNYDSNLSQVIQGTNVNKPENSSNFEYPDYVLLQIHNGADVRGGYTDAKLFRISEYSYFCLENIDGQIGDTSVDNRYNGTSLTDEDGKNVEIGKDDKIELWLSEA